MEEARPEEVETPTGSPQEAYAPPPRWPTGRPEEWDALPRARERG